MRSRPVIFISAVSRELHTARDLVAKTLLALGYEPKWQDIAPTETGDLRAVLRKWIDTSDAVIQLIGHCYGFAPSSPDPTFGPCSFTQYEALYARQQHKPVYYLFIDPTHPTDGCACKPDPKPLHALQENYRKIVKAYGDLYHTTSSLTQTELLVRRLKDDLAHLRKRSKQHAAFVLGLLIVIVLGIVWLKRDTFLQDQASTATIQKVDDLHEDNVRTIKALNDSQAKLLQALRELPQTHTQQPRRDAQEDVATRIARAYTVLETQLKLPPGTLAKELPEFAQQLLQRSDTSTLDRANALFATKKFDEAEAEALKAKDHALATAGQPVQDAIAALRIAAESALEQIHYTQALEHYRAAAALTSKERDVLPWLDLQNEISYLYYLQGRYPEALVHTRQICQAVQQAGQDETRAVLAAHMNYASALDDNGQAAEAVPEYRSVIRAQVGVLGAEHPDTLGSRSNLAATLQVLGKHPAAEQENRAILKVRSRVLGTEHPDTLVSRHNLASALNAQGKHAEAVQEYRSVLQIRERVLGSEHPDTLGTRINLANALDAQGKHVEAEQEYRSVLPVEERVLGAEHPEVALSCYNLALCLKAQFKLPEALKFIQGAEQVLTKTLGPDHPNTQNAKFERERLEAALK